MMDQRSCGSCKEVKSLDQFHKSAVGKDGHHSICKICRNKYNTGMFKLWKLKNPERYLSYQRERSKKRRVKDETKGG